jgi:hypothetical protein
MPPFLLAAGLAPKLPVNKPDIAPVVGCLHKYFAETAIAIGVYFNIALRNVNFAD